MQPFVHLREEIERGDEGEGGEDGENGEGEGEDDGEDIITIGGDEKMTKEEYENFFGDGEQKRKARDDSRYYWPEGRIPYAIDPSLKEVENDIIKDINLWEKWTCLRFIRVTFENPIYK